ncbi:MAG: carboxypeptidase-like regulatory domain-containing protein [Bacteroidota bacterium]
MKQSKIVLGLVLTCLPILCAFVAKSPSYESLSVSGKVTIWNDIPLEKIQIEASKSKQTTYSDDKGEFTIEVQNNDKLKFTATGFNTEKIKVKDPDKRIILEMTLQSDAIPGEGNVVNDGFRHISQRYRATAIERLEEKRAAEFASFNSVWDIIRTRIAGVVVQNNNAYFREGLSGSVSTQSVPALIVLNGAVVPSSSVTNLNPVDLKDINLLKGAAAAPYGGSGGSGVIAITTK